MAKLNNYRITNPATLHDFGVYQAVDADAALDAMARDAGYDDYNTACEVAGYCALATFVVDDEE